MKIFRDPYIILLLVLLMMTLAAFLLRLLPYPVGILVLIALIMMRIRFVRNKQQGRHRE
jgi:1,4-dihydroxy-2-naphthoate octaprenyltransferase